MRRAFTLGLAGLTALAVAAGAVLLWNRHQEQLEGFAQANGRIEVERVDIAAKRPGRVSEIRVREGDLVEKGAEVARLDVDDLLAQLASAKAEARRAGETIGKAKAELGMRKAELKLREVVLKRGLELSSGVVSQTEIDRRVAERDVAQAAVLGAEAGIADAEAARDAAEAAVRQIEVAIEDMTLHAPVAGRVEYRLVQPGEVIGAGGRVVTLLDLSDVVMTIFLPTSAVGRVALGSQARIVLDVAPQYVIPATVSFVASEAQFTPKYVETKDEREKLMYRVKLKIDPVLLSTYRAYVKAGLTGTATVQTTRDVQFPPPLTPHLPEPPSAAGES
jgi:HlyD family secretion protein